MNEVIQGLWIGPELSLMEQLSIGSFLKNGHEYHLYTYDDLGNVPAGTVLKDANEILPRAQIFQYTHQPSYAGFSNFFRYKLLLERGGWWVDSDVVCVRPFDFPDEFVLASERCDGREVVTSGIIKAPSGSQAMAYAWNICQSKEPAQLMWGETGPKLLAEVAGQFSLHSYVKSHETFCPLGYDQWREILEPDTDESLFEASYSVHLWNEMWRAAGQNKNGSYDSKCPYERLKRQYL
ncbi:MAG TPA: glycosyltransferase [Pyrinomonadaceae bacterium]|nr:glycosyltransferase [Pyrinomonadaceae bacterium]